MSFWERLRKLGTVSGTVAKNIWSSVSKKNIINT